MNAATWTGRRCEICGRPIRTDNIVGICRVTPECQRIRTERRKRAQGVRPRGTRRQKCKHPDGCPNFRTRQGWCDMHFYRVERYGDPGPVGSLLKPRIIRVGDIFGKWTALENFAASEGDSRIQCRCECGTVRPVFVNALLYDHTHSCGCLGIRGMRPLKPHAPYLPAGFVAGRLTTLEDAAFLDDLILTRCECGTESRKMARLLKRGQTQSCGCLRLEVRTTHGLSQHPLYALWKGIVRRTSNPDSREWAAYGGRGIRLYEGWQGMPDGFLRFVEYMGERPSPSHSVDRCPDNDGNYEPGNVKWSTPPEQARRKRKVDVLTRERDELRIALETAERALAAAGAGTLF